MKKLSLVAVLLVGACSASPDGGNPFNDRPHKADEISYFKDSRTNLCFAFYATGYQGGPTMATVPCDALSTVVVNILPQR
jgi:hypothetical protein